MEIYIHEFSPALYDFVPVLSALLLYSNAYDMTILIDRVVCYKLTEAYGRRRPQPMRRLYVTESAAGWWLKIPYPKLCAMIDTGEVFGLERSK